MEKPSTADRRRAHLPENRNRSFISFLDKILLWETEHVWDVLPSAEATGADRLVRI